MKIANSNDVETGDAVMIAACGKTHLIIIDLPNIAKSS
tara:strand:- start:439 stop:552 length:114 start_codon:yes stop_codon:yes gene_type:complete